MYRILLFILFQNCLLSANAQLLARKKALPDEKPPKAVLVELFSGYKRLERTRDKLTKPELIEALKKANQKMVMDFDDNFKYCPVYYFYDSNIIAIQNGEIEGKLLDEKGGFVEHPVINNRDTNFFILYYGVLVPNESSPFDLHLTQKMLVALNYKGDVLKYPLPKTPGPATYKNLKSKKLNIFYRYSNKRTETHYRACALRYSRLLERFYGKQPALKTKKYF
ncbi:MAG: hypothetical protein QM530_09255 [Phycisphaerales bacterium]|nr:hypothetical protein [Phycisphaerales bacterium]